MGQAKQRGTQAERLAQSAEAKRKTAEALGLVRRDLNDAREGLGLPLDAPFLGYVVHIPANDEFLADFKDSPLATSRSWTKSPGLAQRFEHFADAYKLAREDREIVVGLFETATQFVVAEVL